MKSIASVVVGIVGLCLTLLSCLAVTRTIVAGAQQAAHLDGGVSRLGGVIGETIVAVSSRGLFAILPALLIYIALVPLRLRERWFYRGAYASSIFFVLVPPFATIYGIVLLIALRRRRGDFREATELTFESVEMHPSSEPSLPPKSEAFEQAASEQPLPATRFR